MIANSLSTAVRTVHAFPTGGGLGVWFNIICLHFPTKFALKEHTVIIIYDLSSAIIIDGSNLLQV